jgi:hypothetical protein
MYYENLTIWGNHAVTFITRTETQIWTSINFLRRWGLSWVVRGGENIFHVLQRLEIDRQLFLKCHLYM